MKPSSRLIRNVRPATAAAGAMLLLALAVLPRLSATAETPPASTQPSGKEQAVATPRIPGRLADLFLKDGLRLRGEIVEATRHVTLRNLAGEIRIPRDEIVRIVYVTPSPAPQRSTTPEPTSPGEPAAPATADAGATPDEPLPTRMPPTPLLTPRQVQHLKLSELEIDGPPENVRVRFLGRNLPEFFRSVHQELQKRADYQEAWADTLNRGPPHARLQLLARTTGLTHVERIEIESDPAVFEVFRRRVLPPLVRGCARNGCHAGDNAAVFRFPVGPTQSEAYVYTSFAMLDRLETTYGPLIDRNDPAGSPLVYMLLPAEDNPKPHPPLQKGRLQPLARSRRDSTCVAVIDWINSLRTPRPDYQLEEQP